MQHERRVFRIPLAIHVQTLQKLPDSVHCFSWPTERYTDQTRLRDVIGDCGRFGGTFRRSDRSLRELQYHADETREYRRFPAPHESKPCFRLSETSGFYRVYGVGDDSIEILVIQHMIMINAFFETFVNVKKKYNIVCNL